MTDAQIAKKAKEMMEDINSGMPAEWRKLYRDIYRDTKKPLLSNEWKMNLIKNLEKGFRYE